MTYFDNQNTEGFSAEELIALNDRMGELGADALDPYYDAQELKSLSEKVFNEFC